MAKTFWAKITILFKDSDGIETEISYYGVGSATKKYQTNDKHLIDFMKEEKKALKQRGLGDCKILKIQPVSEEEVVLL